MGHDNAAVDGIQEESVFLYMGLRRYSSCSRVYVVAGDLTCYMKKLTLIVTLGVC